MDRAGHLPYHAVQFYGNEERLFSTVAAFLAEGLIHGQPAVVIATPEHRIGITSQLMARLINVDQAKRNGDLLLLDAHEMLDLFMHDGVPDADAFEANIGRFIEQILQGRPGLTLRAYGEMVDILWQQGQPETAIRLEILWNHLASRFGFSLLCGYSMRHFLKSTAQLQDVCSHHTHVFGPDKADTFRKAATH